MGNLLSNRYTSQQGSRDWIRPTSFSQENRNPNRRNENMIYNSNNFDNRYTCYISHQLYHMPLQKRARVQIKLTNPSKIASYNRNPNNSLLSMPQLLNITPIVHNVMGDVRPTL